MGGCLGKNSAPAAPAAAKKPDEKTAATSHAAAAKAATSTTPAGETNTTGPVKGGAAPAEASASTTPAAPTADQPKDVAAATDTTTTVAASAAAVAAESEKKANAKILIVYYSTYGHVRKMVETAFEGIKGVEGVDVELWQVPETLPEDALSAMQAPPKADHPVLTYELLNKLTTADGILFGFPTRFGMMCAQMKAFFDSTGGLWAQGALAGKLGACLISTATQGGGQETTLFTFVSQLAHHGMLFVPVGYTFGAPLYDAENVRGGSVYGAGTLAGSDGSRQPTELELDHARHEGRLFAETVKKFVK